MNEDQDKQKNLLDTTDCLEAIGVFRGWKNSLFVIVILCLLLLQASFWAVNVGWVKTNDDDTQTAPPAAAAIEEAEKTSETAEKPAEKTDEIKEAAKQVAAEPNKPAEAISQLSRKAGFAFSITVKHLTWLIRLLNFILIPAAVLYCLTMLFSLKVSLLGRLGGINHIARAFFISLLMLVLLLPWQRFFAGVVFGAIYTPGELLTSCTAETRSIFGTVYHYYRFTGHWLLVVLLLIFSQIRSARWAGAILRRLEVI